MPENPDPIDRILDRWSHVPPPAQRLSAEVWRRIAVEHERPVSRRITFLAWLDHPLAPIGFVAGCAVLGLLAAELQVSRMQRERNAELVRSYLTLIDPLLDNSHRNPRP